MPKIYCRIHVVVEHEHDPKAVIKANNAILSLIRKAEGMGKTDTVTRTGNGPETGEPNIVRPERDPDPDFSPPPWSVDDPEASGIAGHGGGTDASGEPQHSGGTG